MKRLSPDRCLGLRNLSLYANNPSPPKTPAMPPILLKRVCCPSYLRINAPSNSFQLFWALWMAWEWKACVVKEARPRWLIDALIWSNASERGSMTWVFKSLPTSPTTKGLSENWPDQEADDVITNYEASTSALVCAQRAPLGSNFARALEPEQLAIIRLVSWYSAAGRVVHNHPAAQIPAQVKSPKGGAAMYSPYAAYPSSAVAVWVPAQARGLLYLVCEKDGDLESFISAVNLNPNLEAEISPWG